MLINKMGVFPSKADYERLGSYSVKKEIPPEIRELTIAHEPVNVFTLLGFSDENVKPDEFKARVQERLKLVSVKKGGATPDEISRVRSWLDRLSDKSNISQQDLNKSGVKLNILKEAIAELKKEDAYKDVKLPEQSQQQEKKPPLPQCEQVKTWLTTSVDDLKAIKKEEVEKLGLKKATLDVCLPYYEKEWNIKFGYAAETTDVKNTSTCKKLLEEALSLVDYRGEKRFDIFKKYNKSRTNLTPKKPVSEAEFLNTCYELEKTAISSFGFPVNMLSFMILNEPIHPFNLIGLDITDNKGIIESRLGDLHVKIMENITSSRRIYKERNPAFNFKTTCKTVIEEISEIIQKGYLENFKNFIKFRTKEIKLYPDHPLSDREFDNYCLEPDIGKSPEFPTETTQEPTVDVTRELTPFAATGSEPQGLAGESPSTSELPGGGKRRRTYRKKKLTKRRKTHRKST